MPNNPYQEKYYKYKAMYIDMMQSGGSWPFGGEETPPEDTQPETPEEQLEDKEDEIEKQFESEKNDINRIFRDLFDAIDNVEKQTQDKSFDPAVYKTDTFDAEITKIARDAYQSLDVDANNFILWFLVTNYLVNSNFRLRISRKQDSENNPNSTLYLRLIEAFLCIPGVKPFYNPSKFQSFYLDNQGMFKSDNLTCGIADEFFFHNALGMCIEIGGMDGYVVFKHLMENMCSDYPFTGEKLEEKEEFTNNNYVNEKDRNRYELYKKQLYGTVPTERKSTKDDRIFLDKDFIKQIRQRYANNILILKYIFEYWGVADEPTIKDTYVTQIWTDIVEIMQKNANEGTNMIIPFHLRSLCELLCLYESESSLNSYIKKQSNGSNLILFPEKNTNMATLIKNTEDIVPKSGFMMEDWEMYNKYRFNTKKVLYNNINDPDNEDDQEGDDQGGDDQGGDDQ